MYRNDVHVNDVDLRQRLSCLTTHINYVEEHRDDMSIAYHTARALDDVTMICNDLGIDPTGL